MSSGDSNLSQRAGWHQCTWVLQVCWERPAFRTALEIVSGLCFKTQMRMYLGCDFLGNFGPWELQLTAWKCSFQSKRIFTAALETLRSHLNTPAWCAHIWKSAWCAQMTVMLWGLGESHLFCNLSSFSSRAYYNNWKSASVFGCDER